MGYANILGCKPGDKVLFHGEGGYPVEQRDAKQWLKKNSVYEIEVIMDHGFRSDVYLKGFDVPFNTVMFRPAGKKQQSMIERTEVRLYVEFKDNELIYYAEVETGPGEGFSATSKGSFTDALDKLSKAIKKIYHENE